MTETQEEEEEEQEEEKKNINIYTYINTIYIYKSERKQEISSTGSRVFETFSLKLCSHLLDS